MSAPSRSPAGEPRTALVLNLGSASLKASSYALSDGIDPAQQRPRETGHVSADTDTDTDTDADADAARERDDDRVRALLAHVIARLPPLRGPPALVAHRIVHGGDRPGPAELTSEALAQLQQLAVLAPLHQPPALALVHAAMERWPQALQIGVFDTSWHRTMPPRHQVLALPYRLHAAGLKRYGFHGLAFQSAMRQIRRIAPALSQARIVLAHLGGGSSLCAVHEGRSVNTTMDMTPLGGIPMATRSGSLDPGVVLHLQRQQQLSPAQVERMLWHDSGLRGISDESGDMRALLASPSAGARRAIDVYVSSVAQAIAAMAACIQGVDVLAFSGGIGANAAQIRARVIDELAWLGIAVDPKANAAGVEQISAASAKVMVLALAIDEAAEMAEAVAGYRPGAHGSAIG